MVFNNPEEFVRAGDKSQNEAYRQLISQRETGNATLNFLTSISRTASKAERVRELVRNYKTPVAYGIRRWHRSAKLQRSWKLGSQRASITSAFEDSIQMPVSRQDGSIC